MIDLAPSHKTGLPLSSRLIAGSGAFGFADEYAALVDFSRFGALVTNAITLRPRSPAREPRVVSFPGGVLIHTGLPNPGLAGAIREYERRWARLGCPVLLHLAATTAADVVESVEMLDGLEAVAGIEIGFREGEALDEAEAMTRAAAGGGRQPIIVQVPFARALSFARMAERGGAQAVSVAAPPRGAIYRPEYGGWATGRLYGPAVLPQALSRVREVREAVALPVIGAGGVHCAADVEAMAAAGATAVQVDTAVWVEAGRVAGWA